MLDINAAVAARTGSDYQVVYADPPWKFASNSEANPGRNAMRHYPVMTLKQIEAIPVREIVADDAALFMWITTPFLVIGAHIPIMRAWGFEPTAVAFTWIKTKPDHPWHYRVAEADLFFGGGMTTRKNSEVCLLGKRGRSLRSNASVREVVFANIREHSRKPPAVAERIRTYVGPGRRMVELFSRETSPGFEALGNQVGKFDIAAE